MSNTFDIELDLRPGRKKRALEVLDTGELRESDLATLTVERGIKPQPLKSLRDRHHMLAKCIASGMRHDEAAIYCGYTASSVSILMKDDLFLGLVNQYRVGLGTIYEDMHENMAGLGRDAVSVLRERLDEDADSIPNKTLIEIAQFTADRTGHGPATKSTHLHVHTGLAEKLEAARKRVQRMKDITPASSEELADAPDLQLKKVADG